jgi:aspartate dehydrogenase
MKVGIAGFGNIGQEVAAALAGGKIPGVTLVGIGVRDMAKAKKSMEATGLGAIPVMTLSELAVACDVIVEAATAGALPEIARIVLTAGKHLICVSAGGLLELPGFAQLAAQHGGSLQIASGAMPGLDILRSAAEGTLHSVHLKGRIKVEALANEPYVLAQGIDHRIDPPKEQIKVFQGTAAEAAKNFPRHMNVAVAVSLAGIGFERTTIELWMDPHISGAIHTLEIEGDEIGLTMQSRNVPSRNPKTSRIVTPSILAALRSRQSPVRVGS